MSRLAREVGWLSQAAVQADDRALARVVTMLDALKERGEADQVLAMVRERLRALRPPRPLGFARLLFLPLDGAIVPAPRWRRGEPQIPRSAVPLLAEQVQQALGAEAAALQARCAGASTADTALVARLGAALWPAAAAALPATPPPGWDRIGLGAEDHAAVAALCRALWREGEAIWAAMAAGENGPPDALARQALLAVQPAGPLAFAAALASVLGRASQPGSVAALGASLEPQCRGVAQQALDRLLEEPVPELGLLEVGSAAQAAAALLRRLDDLADCPLMQGERQHRLAAQRRAVDEACRQRFLAGAEAQVVGPAARLLTTPAVSDAEVTALEDGARQLRALETVGRRLGGPGAYDKALAAMTAALAQLAPQASTSGSGLRRVDLARTVEILCGPDAAMALLEG